MEKIIKTIMLMFFMSTLSSASGIFLNPEQGNFAGLSSYGYCTYDYQCIDEGFPPSAADYLYSTNYNDISNVSYVFKIEDLPGDATEVNSVSVDYYTKKNLLTIFPLGGGRITLTKDRIVPLLVSGEASWADAPLYAPYYNSYVYKSVTFNENPMTGSEWTVSDVNNLKVGFLVYENRDVAIIAQMHVYVDYEAD